MNDFGEQKSGTKIDAECDKQRMGEVLHRSGTNHHTKGDLEQAEKDYRKAINVGYINQATYSNLGAICHGSGRIEEAIILFRKAVDINPNYTIAHMNLGNAYKDCGNLDQALASTLKSLELKPDEPTALINLGSIYKDCGNLDQARASTLKSLELTPDNPTAHMNLGSIYKDCGNLDQARASTLKSLELTPDNPTAHMNLGGIYKNLGNLEKALASTLKSLELQPDSPDTLINLGGIYKDLERIEEAKTAFNQALRVTKKDTKDISLILNFYEIINDDGLLKQAIRYIKGAISSESIRVAMYEARVLFREKKFKDSWEKLPTLDAASKHLDDWFSTAKYHAFRAEIAERNNNFDAAYQSFEASQIDPLYQFINYRKAYDRIHEYISLSKNIFNDALSIDLSQQMHNASNPVFLLGFPRSGTTLLDSILRSHPNVDVIEEKDPLGLTEKFGIKNLHRRISNFNSLNEDDLNKMRQIYLARLKFHSDSVEKLIIDKLPLHTIAIPLINLLFPNAKIIFALRHPCDSILSCFQQTFKPNIEMANFTDLEKSVDFYDKVMNSWATYNQNLKIDYTISKYEDVVDTFDESILKVLKHLDLPWNNQVRDYRSTAINRVYINTPSSSQVVQPLYKTSIGRWENYQKHFSKHMGKLKPWIKYFGYDL